MINILVECPELIASVRTGVLEPLSFFVEKHICELRFVRTSDIRKKDVSWCDVLVCVRGSENSTMRIVQAAKSAGRFVIYFLDDDLLNIPDGVISTGYYQQAEVRANIVNILQECDALWVVNKRVGEKYSRWCARWFLGKVPALIKKIPMNNAGVLRVLYAGSVDHRGLVEEKLAPAIRQIQLKYPDCAEFTFIGVDPHLSDIKGVKYIPFFDSYDEYRQFIEKNEFDIGLAPAYETSFYACKYYNKFIEYSSFGIAGIYEDCEPYTMIVRDGENGFICRKELGWYKTICRVIIDRKEIKKCAENAIATLLQSFSYEQVAAELSLGLPELFNYKSPECSAVDIKLSGQNFCFYWDKIKQQFRRYGIFAVFKIPYKFIKMLKRNIWRR